VRRSELLAASLLVTLGVAFVSSRVARGLGLHAPSIPVEEAQASPLEAPPVPAETAPAPAIADSPQSSPAPTALARLDEAAHYDDWRAIDASAADVVAGR